MKARTVIRGTTWYLHSFPTIADELKAFFDYMDTSEDLRGVSSEDMFKYEQEREKSRRNSKTPNPNKERP